MIRRPPRSTLSSSSAASDVYKRQNVDQATWQNQWPGNDESKFRNYDHLLRPSKCFLKTCHPFQKENPPLEILNYDHFQTVYFRFQREDSPFELLNFDLFRHLFLSFQVQFPTLLKMLVFCHFSDSPSLACRKCLPFR